MSVIPKEVNEVLKEYFDLFGSKLPDLLEAYYIYGSVSLGAFDYGFSDIDFIAVLKRKATEMDINLLKEIHTDIKRKFHKTDLMGLYVTKNDLQAKNENEESCPCFIDGRYKGLKRFDKNSIDAFQLKKYGIAVKGQGDKYLEYTVNWFALIRDMRENLNTYWVNWKNGCCRFPSIKYIGLLLSLKMVEWGVLGVTRQYYTFREGDMTSKLGAGEYALKSVPQRWHRIINEAMRLRKNVKESYYKSIFERRKDALDYIDFIIKESNGIFKERA